jgi:hypothetical protein
VLTVGFLYSREAAGGDTVQRPKTSCAVQAGKARTQQAATLPDALARALVAAMIPQLAARFSVPLDMCCDAWHLPPSTGRADRSPMGLAVRRRGGRGVQACARFRPHRSGAQYPL